jgi:hypothetical protein
MLEHPAHRSGTTPRIEDGRGVRSPVCFDRFGMVKELRQIISW